jgi:hypothetical protein
LGKSYFSSPKLLARLKVGLSLPSWFLFLIFSTPSDTVESPQSIWIEQKLSQGDEFTEPSLGSGRVCAGISEGNVSRAVSNNVSCEYLLPITLILRAELSILPFAINIRINNFKLAHF